MKSVAGGATGLLTVTWKQFGAGEERQLIPEYRMVTANHRITRTLGSCGTGAKRRRAEMLRTGRPDGPG